MATRWSSEYIIAEHKDMQANAMAVDSSGTYVLLAGRRYLAIKNLNDPTDNLRKFPRQSKFDVGTAEWNLTSPNKHLCAISTNQRIEILSWQQTGELSLYLTLQWHTRVVTALNWHHSDPNLLASCSIDTFTHLWDIRESRKPAISLSAVSGATQVKWNRISRHLLATAHNGDVKIWDQRKGTAPVQYIAAHLANIHALDWSPSTENQLATSSQDCTVKFFDTTSPRRAETIITASSPVWRARYTPFGHGLLMVVVPPMRRGENSLLLWNLNNPSVPVHTFVGHTDVILEFEWRKTLKENTDYQLITWSKDQTLRIWQIEPFLQELCGHQCDSEPTLSSADESEIMSNGTTIVEEVNGVLTGSDCSSLEVSSDKFSDDQEPSIKYSHQPKTLQQEFSLVSVNSNNIQFEKMDVINRYCALTAVFYSHIVELLISFPPSYPFDAAPVFQLGPATNIDNINKTKILKVLKLTAIQRVKKNRTCLEPCLRQLVSTLETIYQNEENDKNTMKSVISSMERQNIFSSFQDAFVPFPRTSGAKFCNVGILVCFCRPSTAKKMSSKPESLTPRALSALGGFNPPSLLQAGNTLSAYYFQDRKTKPPIRLRNLHVNRRGVPGITTSPVKMIKFAVHVYDVSALFLANRQLAERYVLDNHDIVSMCQRNAQAAASVGRRDLVQMWTLASLASTPPMQSNDSLDDEPPWSAHPFTRNMIHSLISHYSQQHDVQTAAMLCCAFGTKTENQDSKIHHPHKSSHSGGGSSYHTVHQADMTLEGWTSNPKKQNRSNSWSESLDDLLMLQNIVEHREVSETDGGEKFRILEDSNSRLYDEYKKAYAELLHRWQLLDARCMVLKYISSPNETHKGIEFVTECPSCRQSIRDSYCSTCKALPLQCVICHLSVRGSTNFCLVCGHGGHTNHLLDWFKKEEMCPTGCGCACLKESANVLE
ncbi:GATOR2 complex protein WDR59 [Bemisia tabaci]|uniref:GATOR2 complex protein WDR59 n=1 Tax=Bemisia tabaci TaxID=7038 RepID=UPI003B27CF60